MQARTLEELCLPQEKPCRSNCNMAVHVMQKPVRSHSEASQLQHVIYCQDKVRVAKLHYLLYKDFLESYTKAVGSN